MHTSGECVNIDVVAQIPVKVAGLKNDLADVSEDLLLLLCRLAIYAFARVVRNVDFIRPQLEVADVLRSMSIKRRRNDALEIPKCCWRRAQVLAEQIGES